MSQNAKKIPDLGNVRPTTSKILESIGNTLRAELEGARVLDLFAGSGALGKMALDNGCADLVFVEGHTRVARELHAKLGKRGRVLIALIPEGLVKLEGSFDIILADPPYGEAVGPLTVAALAKSALLKDDGILVMEHHHKDAYLDNYGDLKRYKTRRFGETAVTYWAFQLKHEEASEDEAAE